jgi:hypothetical protein
MRSRAILSKGSEFRNAIPRQFAERVNQQDVASGKRRNQMTPAIPAE